MVVIIIIIIIPSLLRDEMIVLAVMTDQLLTLLFIPVPLALATHSSEATLLKWPPSCWNQCNFIFSFPDISLSIWLPAPWNALTPGMIYSSSSCTSLGALSLWLLFLLLPSLNRGYPRIWSWDLHSYMPGPQDQVLISDPISRLVLPFQLIPFSFKVMA